MFPDDSAILAGLAASLPAAADRVAWLSRPERFDSDRALLAAVLPFNFR
ncbi:MAG: hypothetical protein JXX28_10965 [Deltaproteobacteria bacterium]|nr:hypothetical protein [Deltaproteobacteria bacterium]